MSSYHYPNLAKTGKPPALLLCRYGTLATRTTHLWQGTYDRDWSFGLRQYEATELVRGSVGSDCGLFTTPTGT